MRQRARRPCRAAFTLVELLVVVAIIGTLVGLLLPAVQSSRESARAAQCRHHLRSIAQAALMFHEGFKAFPPARIVVSPGRQAEGHTGSVGTSTWCVRLSVYLEVVGMDWDERLPFAEQTEGVRALVVPTYLCPSRRGPRQAVTPPVRTPPIRAPCGCLFQGRLVSGGAVTDYAGCHGDLTPTADGSPTDFYWGGNGSGTIISSDPLPGTARWRDTVSLIDVLDGTTQTFLFGEAHVPRGRLAQLPENGPAYDGSDFFTTTRVGGPGVSLAAGPDDTVAGMGLFAFGSWHAGGCGFAFADGHVATFTTETDTRALARLCNRRDEATR